MAEIFPFQAYRYNPERVDLNKVLTQPYDKITAAMQERYYSLDPHNLITIEKGKPRPNDTRDNNLYTRAAQALKEWIAEGVLLRDPTPSVYAYFQEYQVPHSNRWKLRKGFIALRRVEDYSAGIVFRHEQTLAGPKADRLELLRHTRAHTGQLFMLYEDPEHILDALLEQASQAPPPVEVRDEYNVTHRLWPLSDTHIIERFRAGMADKKLVIADGHHRYETALAFRNERRAALSATDLNAAHEKVMMTFVNAHAEGLTILPTHRVISNLKGFRLDSFRQRLCEYFDIQPYPFADRSDRKMSYEAFRKDLVNRGRAQRAIGLYAGNNAFELLSLKHTADLAAFLPDVSAAQRQLDVVLLHRVVLEKGLGIAPQAVATEQNITYEREMDAAIAAVDRAEAQLCCLLNPVDVKQVIQIALRGEVLPQKSTDFYPKLLSGLTIQRLDG